MTDKPSCETCPYQSDRGIAHDKCPMTTGDVFGNFPSDDVSEITKIIGCASHPQAREYLMEPVLEELERQETNYTHKMLDQISRGNIHLEDEFGGISKGFSRAIHLIRNGVEK